LRGSNAQYDSIYEFAARPCARLTRMRRSKHLDAMGSVDGIELIAATVFIAG
jgi:hypothetical protein